MMNSINKKITLNGLFLIRSILLASWVLLLASCVTTSNQYIPYSDTLFEHSIDLQFDEREWTPGLFDRNQTDMINYWVLAEENTQDTCTEYVCFEAMMRPADFTAQHYADWLLNQIAPNAIDFELNTIKDTPSDVMLEWSHAGLKESPAARWIVRIMQGTDGLYCVTYSVQENSMDESRCRIWRTNIGEALLLSTAANRNDPEVQKQMKLVETIEKHANKGLYIIPYIPPEKLKNARESCIIPASETILALIDSTSFGSAKNCLTIGTSGVYIHNAKHCVSPGRYYIPRDQLGKISIHKKNWFEIALGSVHFNTAGSMMPHKSVLALLQDVQDCIQTEQDANHSESDQPPTTAERMKKLQHLKENGLITDQEYQQEMKSLIETL